MDVDLSTDLDALLPLVAPLLSGHSDVAIGSRLAPGASVARHPKREFISRTYNLMLRTVFATRIRDAQCGFKALRADVARRLLPAIADEKWFFDTELLLLAERNGLRVQEIPVDWVDDTDSRVRVARTAYDDLVGMARMARRFALGGGQLDLGAAAREPLADDFGRSFVSFAAIGVVSTTISLVLFLALHNVIGAVLANVVAVTTTFVGNTWANARFTARRRHAEWRRSFAVYVASIALTSVALFVVDATIGTTWAQLLALAVTWTLATFGRLLFLHHTAEPAAEQLSERPA
jgi:putative flippase GtrA